MTRAFAFVLTQIEDGRRLGHALIVPGPLLLDSGVSGRIGAMIAATMLYAKRR